MTFRKGNIVLTSLLAISLIAIAVGGYFYWQKYNQPNLIPANSKDCGSVLTSVGIPDKLQRPQDFANTQCFVSAYHSCTPATLSMTEMSIDTGTNYRFSVEKNGAYCKAHVFFRGYMVPAHTEEKFQETHCGSIREDSMGLHFLNCDNFINELRIPLFVNPQEHQAQNNSTDETANWKTFYNRKIGYQLSYPSSWKNVGGEENATDLNGRDQFSSSDSSFNVYIGATTNPSAISYLKNGDSEYPAKKGDSVGIAGVFWEKYFHKNNDPGEMGDSNDTLVLLTIHDGKTFYVRLAPNEGFNTDKTYLQILSTFQFLDQTQPPQPKYGQSTYEVCNVSSDCQKNGCSGEICGRVNGPSGISSCLQVAGFVSPTAEGFSCSCIAKQCQWQK